MEIRTVMLMLAIGSLVFGLLLIFFRFKKTNPQKIPFWIQAKFLQAAGSLMLYYGSQTFDVFSLAAGIVLLLGCAYEAWAIRILTGQPVSRRVHVSAALGIVFTGSITLFLGPLHRTGLIFLLQSVLYFLPGLFLLGKTGGKSSLQLILGGCYSITGVIFLVGAVICLSFPGYALRLAQSPAAGIIPVTSFCIFLISSFILLMLVKERSDLQVLQMRKTLEQSERRFQRIVETALEGILIFDEDYNITFANQKIASVLGYTIREMVGQPFISFFPTGERGTSQYQQCCRKTAQDSVYECCLLKKDGRKHWFLVAAKAIFDEKGQFDGYVAMLTDIHERKEMEQLLAETNRRLAELSNTDSLTGIANRRCFDATLEHQYSRLRRSNSKLSVILMDVDYFKEFNDYYGHVRGDDCLRRVGKTLTECISRSVDLAARYGGEEFACILPDTDLQGAIQIAETIRQRIHGLQIRHEKSPVSGYVTASFGVTTVAYSPDQSIADIIAMADQLLYKAKAAGRNRIEFAEFKGPQGKA